MWIVTEDDREALADKKRRLDQLHKNIEDIYTEKHETRNLLDKLFPKIQGEGNTNSKKEHLEFTYQSSRVNLNLKEISLGMSIREAESRFTGLRRVEGQSYDLGYGGGGPAYLYYEEDELIFGMVPRQKTETIIAIVAISPKLKSQNGLNPKSTAGEILNKYPSIKVTQGAFHGWEYISKDNENWSFVFKTDGSETVGEYAKSMSETPTEPVNLDIKADWVTIK